MTARHSPDLFAQLAALQDLAGVEHRRTLERACRETDRAADEEKRLADELDAAETGLAAVHAAGQLCLVRLRLAAAIVDASEDAFVAGRALLRDAAVVEQEANTTWQAARHRARWLAGNARTLRREEANRRDEAVERDARALRLALDMPSNQAINPEERS